MPSARFPPLPTPFACPGQLHRVEQVRRPGGRVPLGAVLGLHGPRRGTQPQQLLPGTPRRDAVGGHRQPDRAGGPSPRAVVLILTAAAGVGNRARRVTNKAEQAALLVTAAAALA